MIELSADRARRLVLDCQGLNKAKAFGSGESGMLDCIQRLGYVQVDTISVINRAHHHTFWARVPGYQQGQLDALHRKRKVFEYWSHAAAYLPMQDYRFCLPYMNAIAAGEKHWRAPDKEAMREVLKRISAEGPLKARDFEPDKTGGASSKKLTDVWSSAKPAKKALEQLFIEGKLLISHRDGFQKVFDLAERVLPGGLDTSVPTTEEFCRYLIDRTIQSQGIATEPQMRYLRKIPRGLKADVGKQVQQMLAEKEIVQVSVNGINGGPQNMYYSRPDLIQAASTVRVARKVRLLSPFDNLVIQRKRLSQLFDFEYQVECYVPAAKRIHGYFCLPILFGDQLIGRLDPKADRKNQRLLVRNLVIEKKLANVDGFVSELARKLKEFARFNACETIVVERCNDRKVGSALKALV